MPFLTIPIRPKSFQITFEDFMSGEIPEYAQELRDTKDTRTFYRNVIPWSIKNKINVHDMISSLRAYNNRYETLINTEDKSRLYRSFKIPKSSGGLRQIDAPLDELKFALYELKELFETHFWATYHTSAFAYIKKRCAADAVRRHQSNQSRWFLKLDFKDFFGSTTLDFIISQMKIIFPFSEVLQREDGEIEMRKALSLCFLRGGLPQGTPISPLLTNLMMIPLDYRISKMARTQSTPLCYTRYADDMIISCKYHFKWADIQNNITILLAEAGAPFRLNKKKTRYASSSGRNWILGLMLNQDNEITIGHAKRKLFKTMMFNFFNNYKNGNPWGVSDTQELQGLIAHYRTIEKQNIDDIIKGYERKFNMEFKRIVKEIFAI